MARMHTIVVGGLIAVGLLFRLTALRYGLPQAFYGDELVSVAGAFRLLESHTLWSNTFLYIPPLFSYLLAPLYALYGAIAIASGVFSGIADFKNYVLLNKEYFLMAGRVISALAGASIIYGVYRIGRRVFSDRVALLASAFIAFEFLTVHESQVGKFWILATACVVFGVYFLLRMWQTGEQRWYVAAALAIGFGYGAGYIALVLVPWFLWAHISNQENRHCWLDKKFIWSGAVLAVLVILFSLANPYGFLRQFGWLAASFLDLFGIMVHVTQKAVGLDLIRNISHLGSFLWSFNPLFFVAGMCGIILWAWKKSAAWFEISFFTLLPALYALIMIFGFSKIEYRFIVPIIPFFVLGSSYIFFILYEKTKGTVWNLSVIMLFAVGFFWFSVLPLYRYTVLLQGVDTRIAAFDWLYAHVPENNAVVLDVRNMYINENRKSIEFIKDQSPFWLNTKEKYLLTVPDNEFPKPAYTVYDRNHLPPEVLNAIMSKEHGYYIFDFWSMGEREKVALPKDAKLITMFYPRADKASILNVLEEPLYAWQSLFAVDRTGPYVEVYSF